MKRWLFLGLPLLTLIVLAVSSWLTAQGVGLTGPTASAQDKGTVLLIPGHGGDESALNTLSTTLTADGYRVQIVDIGDGSRDITLYAEKVVALGKTVNGPVSLVGYSQGGLIARAAAQLAPELFGRIATIATPHDGTEIAAVAAALDVACDTACEQMVPGSPFLASLTLPIDPDRWLALYSREDQVVTPVESAALDGATNVAIDQKCRVSLDHYKIVTAPEAAAAVSTFLASGRGPQACRK